jgi:predicted DsbA family dithiol-disulfide isomerase
MNSQTTRTQMQRPSTPFARQRRFLALALLLGLGSGIGPGSGPSAAWAGEPGPGDLGGLDTKSMTPSEVETLKRLLEKFPSACGKPHSLLKSLQTDPKCALSGVAGRYLQKMLSDGYLESEAEEKYAARFINNKCYDIDVAGAAVRGDPKAPITIVEFSDFECPHCRMAEPWLKQIINENPDVKLLFMNFPISSHPNAAAAAAATVAAGKQGKFWAYHDKVFDNQDKLSRADLLKYAEELKLNLEQFKADMDKAKPRVDHDRKVGEKLDLRGTPSFFINCHRAEHITSVDALRSYIEQERAALKGSTP